MGEGSSKDSSNSGGSGGREWSRGGGWSVTTRG